MSIVSICRAYVDLVVSVSEEELAQNGFEKGRSSFLEEDKFQDLISRYVDRSTLVAGGPCANSMAMVASMGGDATYIGKVADDELGREFCADFERRGVVFKTSIDKSTGTACVLVFIAPDGERSFIYNHRIADEISKEDIENNKEELERAKFLYLGRTYSVPECMDIIDMAIGYAKNARIVTTLQTYRVNNHEFAKRILKADMILGNEMEYKDFLSDVNVCSLDDVSKEYPDKIFVCTLGKKGAVIIQNSDEVHIPCVQIDDIKDSTGAGDAWAAGFLYGLSNNMGFKEAGELGAQHAAKILMVTGGRL